MQKQHHSIHTIVLSFVQVFRPLQRAFGKPWLFPSVFARQRLNTFNHHIGKQVECLVFGTRTFLSIRLSHSQLTIIGLRNIFAHFRHSAGEVQFVIEDTDRQCPFDVRFHAWLQPCLAFAIE